ncbi:MAG: Programmed cell death toxin YdcE [uncultured Sulfurovum sp.]|uniref:mRNA interferase n=1 Tax=uncultured Sulfurovum sp. TaxID=269237 RepID=A0A6S6S4I3_9BACT|nr:MAG: Programmed cell death toxin YdcE [uncultured Sulfurovum sp.]
MHFNIYWANLNPTVGREQAGHRPVLVISNDIENQMDIVTVIPITSRKKGRKIYPNEVLIHLNGKEAILLCHQVRTISKQRLDKKILGLDDTLKRRVIDVLCMRFK